HHVGLAEVSGRQEIEVEPRFSDEILRERLVEVDRDAEAVPFGGHYDMVIESDSGIGRRDDELVRLWTARAADEGGNRIPLLGRGVEADFSVGRYPIAVQDDLNPRILLVEEDRAEMILLHENAEPPGLQRSCGAQPQCCSGGATGTEQRKSDA